MGPGGFGAASTTKLAAYRDERGETLALLVLWPTLLVAILLLVVHAFIATNTQSQAEAAASAGLRAAWRSAANADFQYVRDEDTGQYTTTPYTDSSPHPAVLEMARAAENAVALAAATEGGWRWWTPGAAEVQSNWCSLSVPGDPDDPNDRPGPGEPGWVRVIVSAEVFGPLAALWPNRLDRVYAAATGPAVLDLQPHSGQSLQVPAELVVC